MGRMIWANGEHSGERALALEAETPFMPLHSPYGSLKWDLQIGFLLLVIDFTVSGRNGTLLMLTFYKRILGKQPAVFPS